VIWVSVIGASAFYCGEIGVGRRQGMQGRDGESHRGWHFLAAGSKGLYGHHEYQGVNGFISLAVTTLYTYSSVPWIYR
jgi:hypothetical protein